MQFMKKLAARQQDAMNHPPVLVAFLGDSVTHGVFDLLPEPEKASFVPHHMPEKSYPMLFQHRLNELYPIAAVSVLNAGISGDGSKGGLERIERDVLRFNPDVVVVNFGLNDAGQGDEKIGVYAENMRAIFEKILAAGCEAILLTPNFMCSYVHASVQGEFLRGIARDVCPTQNDGVLTRYVEAAREVARSMNIPVADAYRRWQLMSEYGVDTTALLSNGINHPTVEMEEIFAQELLRVAFEH